MSKVRTAYATEDAAARLSTALSGWIANTDPTELWQTCATCDHAQKKGPMLCTKFNLVPPVAIIAGQIPCNDYRDDEEIPF